LQDVIGILHDPSPRAPEVVVATPAGQQHGIGAMLVAASAATVGWRVTYLGADLPAEDIAEAVRSRGADAVALSLIYPPDDPDLPGELVRIWNELPSGVEVVVGGASAGSYSQTIRAIGATVAKDLEGLRSFLDRHATLTRRD
jgi:methylmalonyl-CoA mutase cobalamin-binding subunit